MEEEKKYQQLKKEIELKLSNNTKGLLTGDSDKEGYEEYDHPDLKKIIKVNAK